MTQLAAKIAVIGLGQTGLSCARFLAKEGVEVRVFDTRETPPGLAALQAELPEVEIILGELDGKQLAQQKLLVVSPGVAVSTPAIQQAHTQGCEIVGDIELFARFAKAPIAAITGSNGKSTVTTLLGEMAKANGIEVAVGGNLGPPALDLLAKPADLYVLELSSFQLETAFSLKPKVATVLNIAADHMDRYASFEQYVQAKAKLLAQAESAVYNLDDTNVMKMPGPTQRAFFTQGDSRRKHDGKVFGRVNHAGDWLLCVGKKALMQAKDLQIPGFHNQSNALAALAMGDLLGFKMEAMLQAIKQFSGLPHRTEFVAEVNDVKWFNDSKGTNVGATVAALKGFASSGKKHTILIAGGDGKGADFSPLKTALDQVKAVILIGRDAPLIEMAIAGAAPTQQAKTIEEAVRAAAYLAEPHDQVLLSPACASFDQFSNYIERGENFMAAVWGLI